MTCPSDICAILNIGVNDEASIDISPDGGKTWQEAWSNYKHDPG